MMPPVRADTRRTAPRYRPWLTCTSAMLSTRRYPYELLYGETISSSVRLCVPGAGLKTP